MEKLREIVLRSDTKLGRAFDISIQALIVISLIAFSIETLPDLSEETYLFLGKIEMVIVVIFSIEYVLRVIVTEKNHHTYLVFTALLIC